MDKRQLVRQSQIQCCTQFIDSSGTVGLKNPLPGSLHSLAEYERKETFIIIRNNLSSVLVSCVYGILIRGPKISYNHDITVYSAVLRLNCLICDYFTFHANFVT